MPKYRPRHLLRTHKSAISDGKDASCQIYVTSVHFRIYAVMTAMHLNFPQENRRRRSSAAYPRWVCKRVRRQPMQVLARTGPELKHHPGSKPTIKQKLAAVRMLYDFLVVRQITPSNPAHSVRGPKYVVKKGKTPVWSREDAKTLLESIPKDSVSGLRDLALIAE